MYHVRRNPITNAHISFTSLLLFACPNAEVRSCFLAVLVALSPDGAAEADHLGFVTSCRVVALREEHSCVHPLAGCALLPFLVLRNQKVSKPLSWARLAGAVLSFSAFAVFSRLAPDSLSAGVEELEELAGSGADESFGSSAAASSSSSVLGAKSKSGSPFEKEKTVISTASSGVAGDLSIVGVGRSSSSDKVCSYVGGACRCAHDCTHAPDMVGARHASSLSDRY